MERDRIGWTRRLAAMPLAAVLVVLLLLASCQSTGSTGGNGDDNAVSNEDLFNGANVVNSRPDPNGNIPTPPANTDNDPGANTNTRPPTVLRDAPPPGLPQVEIAAPSRYGCYVPTRSYTFFEHRYVLILYRDANGREAWELTGPASTGGPTAQTTRQLGLGLFGEIPGGFEFRQLVLSDDGQTAKVVATDHIAAREATNRLTLSEAIEEEQTSGTALGAVMAKLGQLHWVRITDVDLMPTAPVYGAFNPTAANGLRDPNARLHLWPDGQWRYAAIGGGDTELPTTIAAGGTWRYQGSLLALDYAAVDEGSGPQPPRPSETYEFYFDATDTKALYLRATDDWTRGWLFADTSAWSVFVPYRP